VVRVYRPYYTFRPRFHIGFGLYLGYPVPYPSWYNPYVYGGYLAVGPGVPFGGLSFEIEPYDAAVFIDGVYVGTVADFSPGQPPLTLRAGLHHVELRAAGYQVMDFDITVVAGQVIPYQGTLAYYR
jgi:hypothetical protein